MKGPRFRELLKVYKNTQYLDNVGFVRGKDLIYYLYTSKEGGIHAKFFWDAGVGKAPASGKIFSGVHEGSQRCREGAVLL